MKTTLNGYTFILNKQDGLIEVLLENAEVDCFTNHVANQSIKLFEEICEEYYNECLRKDDE